MKKHHQQPKKSHKQPRSEPVTLTQQSTSTNAEWDEETATFALLFHCVSPSIATFYLIMKIQLDLSANKSRDDHQMGFFQKTEIKADKKQTVAQNKTLDW